MKKLLLISIIIGTFHQSYTVDPIKELFINQPWDFMEYTFIINAQKESTTILNYFKRYLPTLSVGITAGYATDMLSLNYIPKQKDDVQYQLLARTFGVPLSTILSGYGVYRIVNHAIEYRINYKILKKFIKHWSTNKPFTPATLQPSFETLYGIYSKHGATKKFNKIAPEMINLIHQAIYKHFPEKYQDKLNIKSQTQSYNFFHTVVTWDIARLIDTLAYWISKTYRYYVQNES
ncbi:MAG: hypothetical protein WDZ41_00870 [Candidatus Babeliales bacterium]